MNSSNMKVKRRDDICAVFVHAGAGYHSKENEKKHLEVCELAVEAGMTVLRHGGTAIDAVEVSITVLENAPITNAGFGSNLNEKGVVECDASIVDHFGRSGAAGAVPHVRNPIQLARRIYEKAHQSPGMSRVPPNLLCGEGAADFAWHNKVIIVPDEALVSPSARQRWQNWCNDIAEYEGAHPESKDQQDDYWYRRPQTTLSTHLNRFPAEIKKKMDVARMISGDSPDEDAKTSKEIDGAPDDSSQADSSTNPFMASEPGRLRSQSSINTSARNEVDDDITDTVGAIAVDQYGNIAAGSSSGGIGMKHQGRIGPAALIGIGTHVIPVDPSDEEKVSVAVVTSGTGEHIASTFSANTCATRIYFGQKMGPRGIFDEVTEDEAISAMIVNEFSGHPALENSEIAGSIGIMAVKRSNHGIHLLFAHNTDSFALASMSSRDTKAKCVMSRKQNLGPVAQGGSMIRSHIRTPNATRG